MCGQANCPQGNPRRAWLELRSAARRNCRRCRSGTRRGGVCENVRATGPDRHPRARAGDRDRGSAARSGQARSTHRGAFPDHRAPAAWHWRGFAGDWHWPWHRAPAYVSTARAIGPDGAHQGRKIRVIHCKARRDIQQRPDHRLGRGFSARLAGPVHRQRNRAPRRRGIAALPAVLHGRQRNIHHLMQGMQARYRLPLKTNAARGSLRAPLHLTDP